MSDVPAGTREAKVRFSGTSRNATGFLNFRIDADYKPSVDVTVSEDWLPATWAVTSLLKSNVIGN